MKLKFLFLVGVFLFFIFGSVGFVLGQAVQFTVKGTVVNDATLEGVSSATVTITASNSLTGHSVITGADGSFSKSVTFVDGSTLNLKVEADGYEDKAISGLPVDGFDFELGDIRLTSRSPSDTTSSGGSETSKSVPSSYADFVYDSVNFDEARVYLANVVDGYDYILDQYGERVIDVRGNVYYRLFAREGWYDPANSIVVKTGSKVYLYDDEKLVYELTYNSDDKGYLGRDVGDGRVFYLLQNDDGNMIPVKFGAGDVASTYSMGGDDDEVAVARPGTKGDVVDRLLAYSNGNVFSTNVKSWGCIDSGSAFLSSGVLSDGDLGDLRAEGAGWCASRGQIKEDFKRGNEIWGYSCDDNCAAPKIVENCGTDRLASETENGVVCLGAEICDDREPTFVRSAGKIVRDVAAAFKITDKADEFCEDSDDGEGEDAIGQCKDDFVLVKENGEEVDCWEQDSMCVTEENRGA